MNILDKFIIQQLFADHPFFCHYNKIGENWVMHKPFYYNPQVTFREVPDEISLTIPTLCYEHCSEDCNSQFCFIENWKDKFELLDNKVLDILLQKNSGVSCLTIMTSLNFYYLQDILTEFKENHSDIKLALYIGKDWEILLQALPFRNFNFRILDYIKIGSFKKEFGPLDNPNTNQRFYKISHLKEGDLFENITNKFLQKPI